MRYHVAINGKKYTVDVERDSDMCRQNTSHFHSSTSSAPTPKKGESASAASTTAVQVMSPMPGSVFDIRVKAGDQVTSGQAIIILEAMKMEMEVYASASGTIEMVPVNIGDTVDTSTVLAIIK